MLDDDHKHIINKPPICVPISELAMNILYVQKMPRVKKDHVVLNGNVKGN